MIKLIMGTVYISRGEEIIIVLLGLIIIIEILRIWRMEQNEKKIH